MRRPNRRRGAALLEMAVGLPAVVLLFIGLSDFSLLFWRQAQLEAFARTVIRAVENNHAGYLHAEEPALRQFSETVQAAAARDSELRRVTVRFTRHFACTATDGTDLPLQDLEPACNAPHVYVKVDCIMAVEPLLRVLTNIGFPEKAVSRTFVRVS